MGALFVLGEAERGGEGQVGFRGGAGGNSRVRDLGTRAVTVGDVKGWGLGGIGR
jgi:hypothetical protein